MTMCLSSACEEELDREALLDLSPEVPVPLPADPSNRVADDARAAAWGQALFFDPMTGSVYRELRGEPIVQGEGSPEPDVPRDTPPKPSSKHHKS